MDVVDITSVKDRRIVVTGAASGIGRAIAWGLAQGGAHVVGLDVSDGGVKQLEAEAGEAGLRLVGGLADVADERSVEAAFAVAAEQLGGLDVVFANAGIAGSVGPLQDWTLAQWRDVIGI